MKRNAAKIKNTFSRIFFVNAAGCRLRVKSIELKNTEPEKIRPKLIFLHEGLGCIELWRDFPETLCVSTACSGLVYERKGYGGSEKFDGPWQPEYLQTEALVHLPALLNACDISDTILIGHSDGGSIALLFASAHINLVRGVITEAAHIFVENITLSGIRKAVKSFETTPLKEKLTRYHKENTETIFRRWANRWLSDEFRNWNIEKCLPKITCPVLVLQGEDDKYGTSAQVEGIFNQVSGPVNVKLIPKCGHIPHFEAKEKVLTEMTKFITELAD